MSFDVNVCVCVEVPPCMCLCIEGFSSSAVRLARCVHLPVLRAGCVSVVISVVSGPVKHLKTPGCKMSNRAWVTLATNDSYSLGALVLAHSLRRVGSTYPAVILITPSVTDAMRERLRAVFADVIVVDVLDSRDATHLALLQRPELGITFTKIHCWSLTQFEKCVFLDADTLVVQNCDELFEREELSAAPDVGWPDCFNSGVFVYRPSQATFDALIQFAKQRGSFDGGDQGLLNSYFSSWAHGDINKHLPFLYNVTSAAFYSYLPALKHFGQDLKIIHFIGAAKPWLQTYNWESHSVDSAGHLKDTLQLWWEIFVSSVHRQLDITMVVEGGPPELPPNDTVNYYVPEVDPDSIFPWHHVNPTLPQEEEQQPIDLAMYYDPWVLYPGDIPLSNEILQTTDSQIPGRVEVTQELRDYIWEYKSKQTAPSISCAHDTPDLHLSEPSGSNYEHSHQHSHLSDSQHSHLSDHQHSHLSDNQHSHLSDNQHSHLSDNQHSHLSDDLLPLLQHESYLSHHQHGHSYKSNFSHQHGRHLHHRDQSQQQQHHHHHHQDYYQQEKKDHSHTGSTWTKETQVKSLNDQPVHRYDTHSPTSHGDHREIAQVHHARIEAPKKSLKATKKKIKRLHRIDLGNEKAVTNGDLSSEDEEVLEIEPRHPYDGFYLRHRATIDPYGRKICTHQIPPTPPPTPPPESPEPTLTDEEEEIQDLLDSQTGVAGNLARVVPGAISSQREALDELTRRQGWEAGNIDYLGADSFDNIWAKISQTLNQSPKQPSPPKEAVPVLKDPTPPKETTPAPKQPSPPKQLPAKPPTPPKEQPIKDPSPVKQPSPPKEEPVAAEPIVEEIPATVEAVLAESVPTEARTVAPVEIIPAAAEPSKQESAIPAVTEKAKNEPVMPATPPVTPSDTASTTPVTETAPVVETPAPVVEKPDLVEVPKIPELDLLEASQSDKEVTPKKTLELSATSTDSPPLANTPSKEEITTQQAAKSEGEKARKPTGKLQLSPPVATDPLPTPDSEVEDAASLAQSIIASELATPTVTSPTPPAPLTPASPPPALQQKRLSVDEPLPATPPAGPVSLAQIGVKPKPSIASQIESSITDKVETATLPETPTTPTSPSEPGTPTEVPKKKMVKKSVKKEAVTVAGAETPVPPPRKKEKKPKDK